MDIRGDAIENESNQAAMKVMQRIMGIEKFQLHIAGVSVYAARGEI